MTAYIARLFTGPGPSTGIRKRPRSRYEPEPDAHLGRDPIGIDAPGSEQEPLGDGAPATSAERRHAATTVAAPGAAAPALSAEPADRQSDSVPAIAAIPAESATPPHRRDVGSPLHDGDPRTTPHGDTPHADNDFRRRPVEPAAASLPPKSVPATSRTAPAPGDSRRSDDLAVSAHSAGPRATKSPPPRSDTAPQANDAERHATVPRPETPPIRSANATGPANSAVARHTPTIGPVRADPASRPPAKSPDPAVRQTVVNAIAEPAAAHTTDIVVHIDRIDVRAPSTTTPSAEPRRAGATPTSLDSYLRSRSRRGAR
jgi:hypothetical protein